MPFVIHARTHIQNLSSCVSAYIIQCVHVILTNKPLLSLLRHTDLREKLGNARTIPEIRDCMKRLHEASKVFSCIKAGSWMVILLLQSDMEEYEEDAESSECEQPHPYWRCQPYVRPE